METSYNRIAGQSLERLAALSDGIFAVAMTLLVLDLHVPAAELIHSEGALWRGLARMTPQIVSYIMSFITLGIFWHGQQAQLPLLLAERPAPFVDSHCFPFCGFAGALLYPAAR